VGTGTETQAEQTLANINNHRSDRDKLKMNMKHGTFQLLTCLDDFSTTNTSFIATAEEPL
jgi:hypothetical protein